MTNQIWEDTVRPVLAAVWHIVGALLVAWAFIVVLLAASTQAHIVQRLNADTAHTSQGEPSLSPEYGLGYKKWLEGKAIRQDIVSLDRSNDTDLDRLSALDEKSTLLNNEFTVRLSRLRSLRPILAGHVGCAFDDAQLTPNRVAEAIGVLQVCLASAGTDLPKTLVDNIRAALAEADPLFAVATTRTRIDRQSNDLRQKIDKRRALIDSKSKQYDAIARYADVYDDLDGMTASWMLGGSFLASQQPAVMQIIITGVSGMFGTLLVILVLVVYPSSGIDFTTTKASYSTRVLLGGLIAVCAFVVLGGGMTVLGTGGNLAGGNVNYLALCTIAILAGMFSDRVAHWLSESAALLFKQDDKGEVVRKVQVAAKASAAAKHATDVAAVASIEAERAAVTANNEDNGATDPADRP